VRIHRLEYGDMSDEDIRWEIENKTTIVNGRGAPDYLRLNAQALDAYKRELAERAVARSGVEVDGELIRSLLEGDST
jgi:hypothetical protein